jgi:hypothetical protein
VEDEASRTVLYFTRNISGQGADIFRTQVIDPTGLRRDTNGDGKVDPGVFAPPLAISELNSPAGDARPAIRIDGLELYFHSNRTLAQSACPGPAPSGGQDLWFSTRTSPTDPRSSDTPNRADGIGMDDIWLIRREQLPVNNG